MSKEKLKIGKKVINRKDREIGTETDKRYRHSH